MIFSETHKRCSQSNLRLHKIASNSKTVMEALPVQHSLGLTWNLETDSFSFQVNQEEKPFTRRGVLSTVNNLYDPLGFLAPVVVRGKALLRELSSEQSDWDAPLSIGRQAEWNEWRCSLTTLEQLQIKERTVLLLRCLHSCDRSSSLP